MKRKELNIGDKTNMSKPEISYYAKKLKTSSKSQLLKEWSEAPLSSRDIELLTDVSNRAKEKELAIKYNMTVSGISKWKSRLFTVLHNYDIAQLKLRTNNCVL